MDNKYCGNQWDPKRFGCQISSKYLLSKTKRFWVPLTSVVFVVHTMEVNGTQNCLVYWRLFITRIGSYKQVDSFEVQISQGLIFITRLNREVWNRYNNTKLVSSVHRQHSHACSRTFQEYVFGLAPRFSPCGFRAYHVNHVHVLLFGQWSAWASHSNYLKKFVISSLTERLIGHDVSSKLLYGDHCLIVLDRQFLRRCGQTHGTPFCPGQPLLICFLSADIKQHEDCQHHNAILLYAREHAPSITKTTMQVYVSVKNSTSLPQRIFFPPACKLLVLLHAFQIHAVYL